MAVSLNLVVGVLGELSLGHAGFMCVGAFASAILFKMHERYDRIGFTALLSGSFDSELRLLRSSAF